MFVIDSMMYLVDVSLTIAITPFHTHLLCALNMRIFYTTNQTKEKGLIEMRPFLIRVLRNYFAAINAFVAFNIWQL
jgi:hypothetical protein